MPVIAAADLIVTKILAGRPKDLEDAASVLLERIVASSGGASGLPKPKRIAKKQQTKKQP